MEKFAYKIENADVWQSAMQNGAYLGSALDIKDGFIHLSTAAQFSETYMRYFSQTPNLIVAKIDLELLGDKVKFEPSRGGDLFPHIYGDLPKTAVIGEVQIKCDIDGLPIMLPEFFGKAPA